MLANGELDPALQKAIADYVTKQRAAAVARRRDSQGSKVKNVRPVDPKVDHLLGNKDAVISVVEYSDFECPFCKRFHPTMKQLIANNKGKVNWVYRNFPLSFHNPGAKTEAEAAECVALVAGNDTYWKFNNAIFDRTTSNGTGFPVENLLPLAKEVGVDEKAYQACIDGGKTKQRVLDDLNNGIAAGVNGTPGSILINHATGKMRIAAGALPLQNMQALVDQLLSTK
ncbi:MAG TPA: disulfide bond formation protein DsbA [Gammaproteobacteria bacterium]|nr:disulfide bond formation protein DsbA [Gammaproteobacteria bacterium]